MIDMLVLRCDFGRIQNLNSDFPDLVWPDFRLADMSIPLEQSIDADGDISNTSTQSALICRMIAPICNVFTSVFINTIEKEIHSTANRR
jgi:hypothetical protein